MRQMVGGKKGIGGQIVTPFGGVTAEVLTEQTAESLS
jgi:hypothetical protein